MPMPLADGMDLASESKVLVVKSLLMVATPRSRRRHVIAPGEPKPLPEVKQIKTDPSGRYHATRHDIAMEPLLDMFFPSKCGPT